MQEDQEFIPQIQRPFFLSILCVVIFSYSTIFIILFLNGILFNNWISKVLNDFLQVGEVQQNSILMLSFVGVLLYSLSFFGAYLIWKLKRNGFYIFLISSCLIILLPYLFHFGNIISVIVLLVLVSLILMYFRKLS